MGQEGGTPWPIWAAVTILVALIGVFGKGIADRYAINTQHAEMLTSSPLQQGVGAQSQIDLTSRLGLYSGVSVNRVAYVHGMTLLDLKAAEPNGRVRAAIQWSGGLTGAGSFTGSVVGSAVELSGTGSRKTRGTGTAMFA